MSTPYTFWRCRMKDLISCFYACKVPIEAEGDGDCTSPPQKGVRGDRNPGREKEAEVNAGEAMAQKEEEESSVSWPSCEEEEYIVFCFRDDGGVHVIEERGSENSSLRRATTSTKPATINHQKLTFVKDEEGVYVTNGKDKFMLNEQKYEKGGSIQVGTNLIPSNEHQPQPQPQEVNESEEQGSEERERISCESSDSSTSSFAFPVIQEVWTGSPVLMPRPEGQKPRNVCIQCCKF